MDPDFNLKAQLELVQEIHKLFEELDSVKGQPALAEDIVYKAHRLAELVDVLNHWLSTGGALPKKWTAPR